MLPFLTLQYKDLLQKNEFWKMLLILRRILCILLSFQLSIGQVALLKSLIFTYLDMRKHNFPGVPLSPKHHFLQHYPFYIQLFGCVRYMWTLRCESKHQYFKTFANHTKNFKNLLFSLVSRDEMLRAITLPYSQQKINEIECSDFSIFDVNLHPQALVTKLAAHILKQCAFISHHVVYNGIHYEKDMAVCYKVDDFGNYVLCRIQKILINKTFDRMFFIGQSISITYDEDLGLYDCDNNDAKEEIICVSFAEIICLETVLQYKTHNGKLLYYFKSAPFEKL